MAYLRLFRLVLFVNLCLMVHLTNAQQESKPYSDVSIASPTAASLGKYADIPVNYFTGLPQINLPIYTIKEGPLSLPISLSYHASGLKVWEPSSWVGAGWALNAGGVITRTVVGGPDENATNNGMTETHGYFSDYGYYSYLFTTSTTNDPQEDWDYFSKGFKDGEPDLFFFNFNGYTGKFYFNDDRTPILVPESDLRITCNYPGNNQSISDFTITTPDGTKYFFGRTVDNADVDPVEITGSATPTAGYSSARVISSWYLNKVQSADGKFNIYLDYAVEKYGYFTIATSPVDLTASGNLYGNGSLTGYGLVKNVVQGVRLQKIHFSNSGEVNFTATTIREDLSDNTPSAFTSSSSPEIVNSSSTYGAKALNAISIQDNLGNCKKFTFTYGYFFDNLTSLRGDFQTTGYNLISDKKRLKLNQIAESSCNAEIALPPYTFTYNTTPIPPRRICFGVDHWGFYNGQNGNNGLIPDYYVNDVKTTGANRDADDASMAGGILQKITYPTGGFTTFDYEPNNVYATFNTYESVGLCNFSVHQNGQSSQVTSYQDFTVVGNAGLPLEIRNYSNYPVKFTIAQGTNTPTYSVTVPEYSPANDNPTNDVNKMFHLYTETIPTGPEPQTHPFGYAPPGASKGTLSYSVSAASITEGSSVTLSQMQSGTVTENRTVGGLRVRTITTNDGTTPKNIITSYSYATNGHSNCILFSRPTYIQSIRNDIVKNVGYYSYADNTFHPYTLSQNGCIQSTGGGAGLYYKSAGSLRPMSTIQGYHIGYSQVTVSQTGNGYTVYQYETPAGYTQNFQDLYNNRIYTSACDLNIPNYPPAPLPFDFKMGDLKDEAQYSEANSLLKEITYQNDYTKSTISTPGFIVVAQQGGGSVQYVATKYVLTSAKKIKTHIVENVYPNGYANGGVTTTTDIFYNSPYHNQATLKQVLEPTGEILEAKTKTAFDFVPSLVGSIDDGYAQYLADSTSCRTNYTQSNNYLSFETCLTNARISYIAYRRTNFTDANNTYKTNHDAVKNNSSTSATLKAILQLQDDYNNAPVEVTSWRGSKLLDATYTTFGGGITQTTAVYPNKIYKISLATPSTSFTPAAVSGTSISKDSRYPSVPETIVKFDNGNLVEITPKSGLTTAYIWGYNNTLPIVKATGVDYTTLTNSYNAAAGDIAQLRSQATQYQQLSTYTYMPLVGMTSETDPSGKTVSYEYDALWRLHLIKDQNGKVLKQIDYHYAGQTEPNSATCSCTNEAIGKKCISGQCQQATRINLATIRQSATGLWKCQYIWQWGDGSIYPATGSITEYNESPCFVDAN